MLSTIVSTVSLVISIIGALITTYGVLVALNGFLFNEFSRNKDKIEKNHDIRVKLCSYLILALEFFIASDVVKTVIMPTWEELGMLGTLVAIRTVLSYFLTKEIKLKY